MSPTAISKAYADTSYGQVHYRFALPPEKVVGKINPMIFLHKSASSSASYDSLMGIYSTKGYACYAPDMPGFGGSFDPSEEAVVDISAKATAWYIEVFMEVFTKLHLVGQGNSRKCHIIGHHSGAVLALELAATRPEFVASICLVGPAVMSEEERAAMKEIYLKPFNEPQGDGSHLLKTWDYLGRMGVGEDLGLWQREAVDHIRAWRGRNLIYGAVWAQESEALYDQIACSILLLCARDDVLWRYFGHVQSLRPEVKSIEVKGGNFELDRDVEGIEKAWSAFLETVE